WVSFGEQKRVNSGERQGAVRCRIAQALHAEIPILLSLTDERVDVFDAGLCLVAAKDFMTAETLPPGDTDLARREGWIWVRRPLA
ncbi:MAG: hypothetical protein NFW15_10470, partial [Candidatus Accumulibacter sp.]|nr:hypothetical protein [Accumulibacter sp.]MCM8636353.1 hypothetical protein [Accumulibacter sp.]MCM8640060.1 hypothetical protein [Accumulibacter sp.]